MPKSKPTKNDVFAFRISSETKDAIAAIGKTPTDMINSGLQHEIRSHTHVLLERIFQTKLRQGWLSQKDWQYLSYHIFDALESTSLTRSNFTSGQMIDLLDAFRDLVVSAIPTNSSAIHYYKGNLGSHAESPATKNAVLEAIETAKNLTRSHADAHPWSQRPFYGLIGRNINVCLRDEKMDQSLVNKALLPYWHTIWNIVARKHWYDFRTPINVVTSKTWQPPKTPPPLRDGGVTMTVWTLDDRPNIQVNISLDRQSNFWHPATYPEIEELQRALSSIPKKIEPKHNYITFWDGPALRVSVQKISSEKTSEIVLLIKKGEINLYFDLPEWQSLGTLLAQALAQTDIPSRIEALQLQYGSSF